MRMFKCRTLLGSMLLSFGPREVGMGATQRREPPGVLGATSQRGERALGCRPNQAILLRCAGRFGTSQLDAKRGWPSRSPTK